MNNVTHGLLQAEMFLVAHSLMLVLIKLQFLPLLCGHDFYSGIYGHIQSLLAIEVHDHMGYCNHSLQAISFVLTTTYLRWQELE